MRLETVILVTTFALLGASLLLSGKREPRSPAARARGDAAELDALVRPALLFTTTAPVAHC
ncbi:MAG: hypothetical protein ACXU86_09600 [Archangium sp.]